jgi:hypothetical protein
MSTPRVGFVDNFACALETLPPLGLRMVKGRGVFWGIVLTNAIEHAIENGAKYVLTIDYDTLFTGDHVRELYRLMEENPHLDAVCPVQVRRDADAPLIVMRDSEGTGRTSATTDEFHADYTPVASGAFGLTIIRASAFADIRRPWFLHQPDTDGRWAGEGMVHEDVRFWHKWTEAGKTLAQANYVSVGHLELVARWLDRDLSPVTQKLADWQRDGVPAGIAG